jgi:enoyl-CoA hydratase/carnithine racemase
MALLPCAGCATAFLVLQTYPLHGERLREMKREMWNAQFQSLGSAIEAANADMPASFLSEDFKEGVASFVEKRTPRFTGR